MAEYIEREALLKKMHDSHTLPFFKGHMTDEDVMFNTMVSIVEEQPISDVVSVVRCKDCKFSRKPKAKERYIYFEGVLLCESCEMSDDIYVVNSDDYCSCGERKVNNE